MKIGLENFTSKFYKVNKPNNKPFGDSESRHYYKADQLAQTGHEVIFFIHQSLPRIISRNYNKVIFEYKRKLAT